ncbi:MAG: polysaccharide pyruvyl transferase family protein [Spirochaetales bacterium]|nr:polysaccharide pyruvyl transferase family protein [Spirochaetales bacterium]
MEKRYGILSYNSFNIGDEIQSIAASRFLPRIDYRINREQLSLFRTESPEERVDLIMNAWYMWRPKYFIPPSSVHPLLISMCIGKSIQNGRFLNSRTREFLIANGPVGCRDRRTLEYLSEKSIPAYFSGCLTSTLIGGERRPKDYVICIDVDREIVEHVERISKCPVHDLSKYLSPYLNSRNRFEMAKIVLCAFRDAKAIVTTNFHTAMPAMAFGTPCCLIRPAGDGGDFDGRMMGYEDIITAYTKEEFLRGDIFDVNDPEPVRQSEAFQKMRASLEEKCSSFTGYDSHSPVFGEDFNPSLKLLELLKYDYTDTRRVLLFARKRDLFSTAVKRLFGKTYLDSRY